MLYRVISSQIVGTLGDIKSSLTLNGTEFATSATMRALSYLDSVLGVTVLYPSHTRLSSVSCLVSTSLRKAMPTSMPTKAIDYFDVILKVFDLQRCTIYQKFAFFMGVLLVPSDFL